MAKIMRKGRIGEVVRTNQDKTAIVEMIWKQRHRLYHKQMRRVARFYVHDPENQCRLGDTVRIEETRPISKTKHWRLMEILERKQVADVRPIDLESDVALEITQPRILAAEARAEAAESAEEAVDPEAEEPEEEAVGSEAEEPEEEAVEEEPEPEEEAADEPDATEEAPEADAPDEQEEEK
ncbi:MAG: 30S ribosomal protein S17 [Chloroflexi bacterium]|nr:30S ribosomal protein S17 [Chloroflexota bacterium]